MNSALAPAIQWRRSSRAKRISLRIEPVEGAVIITLPPRASKASGLAFLHASAGWVERNLNKLPQHEPFANGGTIMLEGDILTIRHAPEARRGVWRENDVLHVSGEEIFLPRRVLEFLRREATVCLNAHVRHWAEIMSAKPSQIVLREVRSRWGSCTRAGRIMLSWRLVMTPPAVRDYIIIHELAHLSHFNHGPLFWKLVENHCPERREAERWLRQNGAALLRVG
ncbi:SprT family zinc-dependent metalloprotease [Kozakia baliensis]|uniref:M48 family metallopeptidase n=1 Tax=Kozakia baliensis TaxID=153496 RepID=UPI00345BCE78